MSASIYQTEDGARTWRRRGEVEVHSHDETGLVTVDQLDVSAGAFRIDGTPVALEGQLWVKATTVTHVPHCYKAGEIKIETPFDASE